MSEFNQLLRLQKFLFLSIFSLILSMFSVGSVSVANLFFFTLFFEVYSVLEVMYEGCLHFWRCMSDLGDPQ